MTRDDKGRFGKGNEIAKMGGRPVGSGKNITKELVWESIDRLAWLLFKLPDAEMVRWVAENKNDLTRAELIYLEAIEKPESKLRVCEMLLDRIVGKSLQLDGDAFRRDPMVDWLLSLNDDAIDREIESLLKNREIINAEYKQIEDVQTRRDGEPQRD